jgi:hypothetical protein
LQDTQQDEINYIKNREFSIVSGQLLEEGHKLFELKATNLKTGESITFEDTFIYYSIFTAICEKPFIEVGDTLIKKKGELVYHLYKKKCHCEMVFKDNPTEVEIIDYHKSGGCN